MSVNPHPDRHETGRHESGGWLGAAVVVGVAIIVALSVLATDWRGGGDGLYHAQATRPLIMVPVRW